MERLTSLPILYLSSLMVGGCPLPRLLDAGRLLDGGRVAAYPIYLPHCSGWEQACLQPQLAGLLHCCYAKRPLPGHLLQDRKAT